MRLAPMGLVVLAGALLLTSCLPQLSLPAPVVSIEPSEPDAGDDLTLVLESLSADGAGVTWQIAWDRGTRRWVASTERCACPRP